MNELEKHIILIQSDLLRELEDSLIIAEVNVKTLTDKFKRRILKIAIAIHEYNYAKAARELKLNRTTLMMMVKKYNINKSSCENYYKKLRKHHENLLGDE